MTVKETAYPRPVRARPGPASIGLDRPLHRVGRQGATLRQPRSVEERNERIMYLEMAAVGNWPRGMIGGAKEDIRK